MMHTDLLGILRRVVYFSGAAGAFTVALKASFKNTDESLYVCGFNLYSCQGGLGMSHKVKCLNPLSQENFEFTASHRRNIIFIRHGQYETKAKKREDKVLTDLGWRQAYATGSYLKKLGIKIDYLIHSDLIRARQTTAAILAGLFNGTDDFDDTVTNDNDLFSLPVLVNLASAERYANAGDYSLTVPYPLEDDDLTPASRSDSSATSLGVAAQSMGSVYKPFRSAEFLCQQSRLLAEGCPPARPEPHVGRSRTEDQLRIDGARLDTGYDVHLQQGAGLPISKAWPTATIYPPLSSPDVTVDIIPTLPPPISTNQVTEDTVVFVGHANVFRYWLCRMLDLPPEAWLRFSIYHGSITSLVVHYRYPVSSNRSNFWQASRTLSNQACEPKVSVTAVRVGEVGHLPVKWLTR